jgi:hypothetical protein
MIDEPGWRSDVDSARPARPGAHPADVGRDLVEADGDGPQLPAQLGQAVARALRLEWLRASVSGSPVDSAP